jgi:Amt family ammonium transporter
MQISFTVDQLWVLVSAVLIFFMQAGFKALEAGLVKAEHSTGVAVKNLMDWIVGGLVFFFVGFGVMFGPSLHGFIGQGFMFGEGIEGHHHAIGDAIFFVFQLGFAGTSLTIVSGAMSGRTGLIPYLVGASVMAAIIYPVVGHWAWGNSFIIGNPAWLANMGFIDFAGSTVVHSTGAWVSLVGVWVVGPRLGRFDTQGNPQPIKASSYSYAILGTMILWMGWFGFNGGSTLKLDASVPHIIVNTNMAASAAALVAFLHAYFFQKREDIIEKLIGGALTGLVAITASCNIVSFRESLLIGTIAGVVHNYGYVFILHKLKLDDSVGAIPVHGLGGVLGTLAVGFFGDESAFIGSRLHQIFVQSVGVIAVFTYTTVVAGIMFLIIKRIFGLRVSVDEEIYGHFVGTKLDHKRVDNTKLLKRFRNETNEKLVHISVQVSTAGHNLLSVAEFLEIPSDRRRGLIEQERVTFIGEKGNLLNRSDALGQLGEYFETKNQEVVQENQDVKQKQEKILQGLHYARGIQKSVLPSYEYMQEVLGDHVILGKPKDIVSGDFLWIKRQNKLIYFAVGDCTGHGVAAAFVSILGISLLNQILEIHPGISPELMLDKLRKRVKKALHQSDGGIKYKEGMDIALCVIDADTLILNYAGAYNPVYIVREEQVTTIKGDRMPVGIFPKEKEHFTLHQMQLQANDMLYLATDGYIDQLNRDGNRKFLSKNFKNLLAGIADRPMVEQRQLLKITHTQWRGETEQIDDILVVGMRIADSYETHT